MAISPIQQGGGTVIATVSGGTLFALAAERYGDFTGWWLIAQANGITDPWLSGQVTLIIPPWSPSLSGGEPPQQ
jgi:hypothetical protein